MNSEELDKLLDDALASYSCQEPRAGLPGRVMARVQSEGERSPARWFVWAFAAAALACVVVALMMWRRESPAPLVATSVPPHQEKSVTPPLVTPPVGAGSVQAVRQPAVRRYRVHSPAPQPLPKRESLPSPDPPSVEERTLLAFAQLAPEAVKWLQQPEKPLEIEAITIRPLEIDGLSTGENK